MAQQAGYDEAAYDTHFRNTMYAQLGNSTLDGIFNVISYMQSSPQERAVAAATEAGGIFVNPPSG